MYLENKKFIDIFFAVAYVVLFISTVIGGIYLITTYNPSQDIVSYIDNYTNSIKKGMNLWGIAKSSSVSYTVLLVIIFLTSFFRIGPVISLLMIARKGFIDGFTLSAMFMIRGMKGIHLYIPYLPQALIVLPFISLFTAISATMSANRKEMDRKSKIIYIIFFIIIITIFCISSFFEGLLTTTFAKWLAFKVT